MASFRQKISEWFTALKSEGFSNKLKQRVLGTIVLLALAVIIVPIFFTHNQSTDDPIKLSARIPAAPAKPASNMEAPPESTSNIEDSEKAAAVSESVTPNNPASAQVSVATNSVPSATTSVTAPSSTQAPAQAIPTNQLVADSDNSINTSQVEDTPSTTTATPTTTTQNVNNAAMTPTSVATTSTPAQTPLANAQPVNTQTNQVAKATVVAPNKPETKITKIVANSKDKLKKTNDIKKTKQHSLHPAEAWAIQLGTFSSKANASDLIKKVRAQGYTAYMHESQSGQNKLFRVYVGPEIKRTDAQVMAERLEKLFNLKGMVVKYKI